MLEGGCNDGFVRPDALLVVVVVQATQDNGAPAPRRAGTTRS
jgi:hypothetical protein